MEESSSSHLEAQKVPLSYVGKVKVAACQKWEAFLATPIETQKKVAKGVFALGFLSFLVSCRQIAII